MERIPPSARVEAQIDELLSGGLSEDGEHLAELGRLGARLVLQRAVEEEVTAFLGRARYERTLAATGSRNGTRPKPIQTAEGEITIAMSQVRNTAEQEGITNRGRSLRAAPDEWRSPPVRCAVESVPRAPMGPPRRW